MPGKCQQWVVTFCPQSDGNNGSKARCWSPGLLMVRVTTLKAFIQERKWLNQSQLQPICWQILDTGAGGGTLSNFSMLQCVVYVYNNVAGWRIISQTSSCHSFSCFHGQCSGDTPHTATDYRVIVHQHSDKDLVSRNGGNQTKQNIICQTSCLKHFCRHQNAQKTQIGFPSSYHFIIYSPHKNNGEFSFFLHWLTH